MAALTNVESVGHLKTGMMVKKIFTDQRYLITSIKITRTGVPFIYGYAINDDGTIETEERFIDYYRRLEVAQ